MSEEQKVFGGKIQTVTIDESGIGYKHKLMRINRKIAWKDVVSVDSVPYIGRVGETQVVIKSADGTEITFFSGDIKGYDDALALIRQRAPVGAAVSQSFDAAARGEKPKATKSQIVFATLILAGVLLPFVIRSCGK